MFPFSMYRRLLYRQSSIDYHTYKAPVVFADCVSRPLALNSVRRFPCRENNNKGLSPREAH